MIYSSDSKCDVPLEFETIGITGFGDILAGPPYPNPASGIVQIPIKIFYTESEPDYNLFLTDTYHQQSCRRQSKIFLSQKSKYR